MAQLSVLRTDGKENEIIEKSGGDVIRLFISGYKNSLSSNEHEIGDILTNDESVTKFALIAKEDVNSNILVPALRVSVINLFKHIVENNIQLKSLLISRYQFTRSKDELVFISTIRELLLTYFGEAITDQVTLVISDCHESE